MLIIESGRFRHAQLRWAIVDKEGYVFGEKLHKYAHWINGGRYCSALFTDHWNLLCFYDDKVTPSTCTKPNRQRLTRWGLNLRSLRYEIFPINGDDNYLADIGSRRGNRFAGKPETPVNKDRCACVTRGPNVLTKAWLQRVSERLARSKCALRLSEPKVHLEWNKPDIDAQRSLVLDMDTQHLQVMGLDYVRKQQDKVKGRKPDGVKIGDGGVWKSARGLIWVPTGAAQLKNALFAVAHQGPCGHRGCDVTMRLLGQHFEWKDMKSDVEARISQYLQCIKTSHGKKVPRPCPLGTQLIPERPGEILMADYIKMWSSKLGRS